MNDDIKKKEVDQQLGSHQDEGIDWDNGEATYGHKRNDFKRKDEPDETHLAKADADSQNINKALKNANFSQNEDIANRNKDADKGIRGKDL